MPEFKKENIREIIFHNYRIVYKTEKGCMFIVSLCRGSIDIVRKAKTENWEIK